MVLYIGNWTLTQQVVLGVGCPEDQGVRLSDKSDTGVNIRLQNVLDRVFETEVCNCSKQ